MPKLFGDYPFAVDKQRVQDLPDPGGTQGGGDVEFAAAAEAVPDRDVVPYVPPLPVPIMAPVKRDYRFQRGLRSSVWQAHATTGALPRVGVLATGETADAGEDFPINSIMVDNTTSLWLSWPEMGVFVPPFVVGKVFRFDGSHRKRILFESPPNLATAVTPTSVTGNQVASVRFYEELLPETAGISLPTTDR